mmetsp:Transcript_53900/g.135452  ORF Transcript_53900/g.135452 Transcript_53900/m.135452 type:complete len:250 (+) Transcript_53900:1938-2687(+)
MVSLGHIMQKNGKDALGVLPGHHLAGLSVHLARVAHPHILDFVVSKLPPPSLFEELEVLKLTVPLGPLKHPLLQRRIQHTISEVDSPLGIVVFIGNLPEPPEDSGGALDGHLGNAGGEDSEGQGLDTVADFSRRAGRPRLVGRQLKHKLGCTGVEDATVILCVDAADGNVENPPSAAGLDGVVNIHHHLHVVPLPRSAAILPQSALLPPGHQKGRRAPGHVGGGHLGQQQHERVHEGHACRQGQPEARR